MKKNKGKKALKIILIVLGALIAMVLIYLAYVIFSYDRIEDKQALDTKGTAAEESAHIGTDYTIVTQNLGFGAYTPDFTFFMDGGTQSWANSKDSVINCIDSAITEVTSFYPDFILFQEIDTDSTRSYHVNEETLLFDALSGDGYNEVFAVNYHSAFLFYPFTQPHGASNSGIATFSKISITSAIRRQLEISTGFSKFLDLDRCYSVSRIPVDNGKELVLYNVHLSAYGGSDAIRTSQMSMLFNDMKAEYEKGNYCVCGGDFNHDFTGDSTQTLNGGSDEEFGWAMPFPEDLLPDCIMRCIDYEGGELIATTRNCDIPYGEDSFTVILDGFLVTENVKVHSVKNIDTGFTYSDHNPVVMQFELMED